MAEGYEQANHHPCPGCGMNALADERRCRACGRSLSNRQYGYGGRRREVPSGSGGSSHSVSTTQQEPPLRQDADEAPIQTATEGNHVEPPRRSRGGVKMRKRVIHPVWIWLRYLITVGCGLTILVTVSDAPRVILSTSLTTMVLLPAVPWRAVLLLPSCAPIGFSSSAGGACRPSSAL